MNDDEEKMINRAIAIRLPRISRGSAAIQAYKETKAFRQAAIEYVRGVEWPMRKDTKGYRYDYDIQALHGAKTMLTKLQEEIENET